MSNLFTTNKYNIRLYSARALNLIQQAATINSSIIGELINAAVPGTTMRKIDALAGRLISKHSAIPLFKGYNGFPDNICASVNKYIVHGTPDNRILQDGDVISIDIGIRHRGFCSDMARTIILGGPKVASHSLLVESTKKAFSNAIKKCFVGNTIGDIGSTIQTTILSYRKDKTNIFSDPLFTIFHRFQGHGIGFQLHEEPGVPNLGFAGMGFPLEEGMCICIEPISLFAGAQVIEERITPDLIKFSTHNGSPSSHYENQVFITNDGPICLTSLDV